MRLEHFPPEFYDIINAVADGEELSMTFPTANVACRRRNKFYDFRVQLRKEAAAGRLPEPMGLEEVAIERTGATLRFYPRSSSPLASDMRAMLALKHAERREDGTIVAAEPAKPSDPGGHGISPANPFAALRAVLKESGGDSVPDPPATRKENKP